MKNKTIVYRGNEYEVPKDYLKKLRKMGVKFNDDYITYLFEHDNPYRPGDLTWLMFLDLKNRRLFAHEYGFGRIVKLTNRGEISEYFDTPYDAIMDAILTKSSKYTFEGIHKRSDTYGKKFYNFFKMRLVVDYGHKDTEVLKALQRAIRRCKNFYFGRNSTVKDMWLEKAASRMSYQEYAMQKIRYEAFRLGNDIPVSQYNREKSSYVRKYVGNEDDYYDSMIALLCRYSKDDFTAFERVQDITYFGAGVYLLCIPKINGCYVGTTESITEKEIAEIFIDPKQAFYQKCTPNDVERIFVMRIDKTFDIIESIEEDCIATLGPKVCLNATAGSMSNELISSKTYDAKEHLLSADTLEKVIEDSKEETRSWKEFMNSDEWDR